MRRCIEGITNGPAVVGAVDVVADRLWRRVHLQPHIGRQVAALTAPVEPWRDGHGEGGLGGPVLHRLARGAAMDDALRIPPRPAAAVGDIGATGLTDLDDVRRRHLHQLAKALTVDLGDVPATRERRPVGVRHAHVLGAWGGDDVSSGLKVRRCDDGRVDLILIDVLDHAGPAPPQRIAQAVGERGSCRGLPAGGGGGQVAGAELLDDVLAVLADAPQVGPVDLGDVRLPAADFGVGPRAAGVVGHERNQRGVVVANERLGGKAHVPHAAAGGAGQRAHARGE